MTRRELTSHAWNTSSNGVAWSARSPPDQLDEHVAKLLESNYSIHFHAWGHAQFGDFLKRANDYLGNPFAVEYYGQNGIEVITILRKLRPASTAGIIPWISTLVKVRNRWFKKAS